MKTPYLIPLAAAVVAVLVAQPTSVVFGALIAGLTCWVTRHIADAAENISNRQADLASAVEDLREDDAAQRQLKRWDLQ